MATPGGPVILNGQEVGGYRGLADETEAFLRKLLVETQMLQPGDAAKVGVVGPTFYIAMGTDPGGNVLVALHTEYPLNPNVTADSV